MAGLVEVSRRTSYDIGGEDSGRKGGVETGGIGVRSTLQIGRGFVGAAVIK